MNGFCIGLAMMFIAFWEVSVPDPNGGSPLYYSLVTAAIHYLERH